MLPPSVMIRASLLPFRFQRATACCISALVSGLPPVPPRNSTGEVPAFGRQPRRIEGHNVHGESSDGAAIQLGTEVFREVGPVDDSDAEGFPRGQFRPEHLPPQQIQVTAVLNGPDGRAIDFGVICFDTDHRGLRHSLRRRPIATCCRKRGGGKQRASEENTAEE